MFHCSQTFSVDLLEFFIKKTTFEEVEEIFEQIRKKRNLI